MSTDTAPNIFDLNEAREKKKLGRILTAQISTGEGFYDYQIQEEATGKELTDLRRRVEALENLQSAKNQLSAERASPENIYRLIGPLSEEEEKDIPILLRIRELLGEGLEDLRQALSEFSSEIEREGQIDIFFNCIRKITLFPRQNRNFQDALTALIVALESHLTKVYSREEILALKTVTKLLKDNIFMTEDILDQFLDRLEEAGFDLSYPLKEIDFYELS